MPIKDTTAPVICAVCRKTPEQLPEYVQAAAEDHAPDEPALTPTEYVIEEEGTYNPIERAFYCTDCYIKIGQPLTHQGYASRSEYRPARRDHTTATRKCLHCGQRCSQTFCSDACGAAEVAEMNMAREISDYRARRSWL